MNNSAIFLWLCGGAWTLMLATLKLAGVIAWSWWLVTAPFWGSVLLVIGVTAGFYVIAFVLLVVEEAKRRVTEQWR
jgi:hypothetical protein